MKGKRVSLGAPGSGTAVTSAALLEPAGIDVQKDIRAVYLNDSETTSALGNGRIDAGFIVGGQGVDAVTQVALTHDIRLLSLSDDQRKAFIGQYPAYSAYTIPAGIYHGAETARIP